MCGVGGGVVVESHRRSWTDRHTLDLVYRVCPFSLSIIAIGNKAFRGDVQRLRLVIRSNGGQRKQVRRFEEKIVKTKTQGYFVRIEFAGDERSL